jgi:hypothetical protein
MPLSSLWSRKKDKPKANGNTTVVSVARGAGNPRVGAAAPAPAATAQAPISEKELKKQRKEKAKQEKIERKRFKKLLKPHKGNVLNCLQDAISRSSIPDIEIIIKNANMQTMDIKALETVMSNASTKPNQQAYDHLLIKLPAYLAFGDDFLVQNFGLAVGEKLWARASSILHRFNQNLLLSRLRYALRANLQEELRVILQEFPSTIKLLDPDTERHLVPEEMSRIALTTVLLNAHSNNFSNALVDSCRKGAKEDVQLLITNPAMKTRNSDLWIHAIQSASFCGKLETLSLVLDRSPPDDFVRQCMLRLLRSAVNKDESGVVRILLDKYIKTYSVLGVWNDMGFADERYLKFYLSVRPTYVCEVAKKSGQTIIHFILSQWPKRSVMELIRTNQAADLEDRFETPSGKSAGKSTEYAYPGVPGDTPVIRAVRMGNSEIAHLLIDWGADLNATDNEGRTALLIATEKRYASLLDSICRANPGGINASDSLGRTALHIAVEKNDTTAMHMLLGRGIGTKALNLKGETACDIAIMRYNQTTVNIIRDYEGLPPASVYDLRLKVGLVAAEDFSSSASIQLTTAPSIRTGTSVYPSTLYPPVKKYGRRRGDERIVHASDPEYWY